MFDNPQLDSLIERLVAATDSAEKLAVYKEWAVRYDSDVASTGYIAPQSAAKLLKQHVGNKNAYIYDAGCGTGLVGRHLAEQGYGNLLGADFSAAMLQVAKLAGVYKKLVSADYTRAIDHKSNEFDAAISIGVYSKEFKNVFLNELLRIVKPDGHIVLSCRPVHFDNDAKPEIDALVTDGRVAVESMALDTYMTEKHAQAWYVVLRVIQR